MSEPFEIRYAALAADDIRGLLAFHQRKVLDGIETHLTHQPRQSSKSRIKAMEQPFWSEYRLRVDEFRVYYDVDEEGTSSMFCGVEKGTETTPQNPPEKKTDDEDSNLDR